tara:strand:- start:46 stop:594 length:549 start_codon:yes stop_codon:yes gene_type:complete
MINRIENRPFGWMPDEFSLKGIDGELYSLQKVKGTKGLVVVFICNHCPYVKAITSQLVYDVKILQENEISTIAIMSNDYKSYPEDNYENMKKFGEGNNFNFPYVIDETQLVAKNFMALCTPDFFGFDSDLKLQYRGRLNDSGKGQSNSNTKHELVDAMLSISKNGIRPENQLASIGCSIKWK